MPCTVCIRRTYKYNIRGPTSIPIPFQPSSHPSRHHRPRRPLRLPSLIVMSAKSFFVGVVPLHSRIMNIQPDDRPIAIASFPNPHPKRKKKRTAKTTRPTGCQQQEKDSGYKTRYNDNGDDAVRTQEEENTSLDAKTAGRLSQAIIIPIRTAPKASPAPRKETTTKRNALSPILLLHPISYTSKIVCTGVWICAACAACA